jgi:hypothetical protein
MGKSCHDRQKNVKQRPENRRRENKNELIQ